MGCILRPTRAIWATFNEKHRPTQNAPQKKGPGGWGVRGTTGALWNLGEVVFIWANVDKEQIHRAAVRNQDPTARIVNPEDVNRPFRSPVKISLDAAVRDPKLFGNWVGQKVLTLNTGAPEHAIISGYDTKDGSGLSYVGQSDVGHSPDHTHTHTHTPTSLYV